MTRLTAASESKGPPQNVASEPNSKAKPTHIDASDADELRAAAARLREMAAKARRFKGWRIRYELQRVDTTWAEVKRPPQCDLRSVSESARWLRQKRIDHVRNVRVMRVFRKAKKRGIS